VFSVDGVIKWHIGVKTGNPFKVHHIEEVKEKWSDKRGAVFFKAVVERTDGVSYTLIKTSSDRKTMEILWATRMDLLPAKMDSEAKYCSYYIYFRQ
jgi:hypothetical protein